MNIISIISKKSVGKELTRFEIFYFVNEFVRGNIEDYQSSALLMAIKINGFTDDEIFYYTQALIDSGQTLKLDPQNLVDKHSTGGIGDKVSLILLPILRSLDIRIIKFSGRGLGITGGTIDKIEVFKNIKLKYSLKEIEQKYKDVGILLCEASKEITPADKKIYELRDVTGTSDSIPLIAASIMSKKLATNADSIFIDLKYGTGALLKNVSDINKLSEYLILIAKKFRKNISIIFSNMNQPLGFTVGNGIEIKETVDFLKGTKQEKNLKELIYKIVCLINEKAYNIDFKETLNKIDECINSGEAYKWFEKMLIGQNVSKKDLNSYFNPKYESDFKAWDSGYIEFTNIDEMGGLMRDLKIIRSTLKTNLDLNAGIEFKYKHGDKVVKGENIIKVYSDSILKVKYMEEFKKFIKISKEKPTIFKQIDKVITN